MKVAVKFYEQQFSDKASKKAYLNACKWIAVNVINKVEVGETTYTITKINADLPTFKLELYGLLDSNNIDSQFCEACKQFHRSFFVNQEYNCNVCKMKAYLDTIKQKVSIKRSYRKERLGYLINE